MNINSNSYVFGVTYERFEEFVEYHCIKAKKTVKNDSVDIINRRGLSLMIKVCPIDYDFVLPSITGIIDALEGGNSNVLDEIVIIYDTSKKDDFLRSFTSPDENKMDIQLNKLFEEKLIDRIDRFDGKDIDMIKKINKKYFGIEHTATHSESKAQYISTLWGLERMKKGLL